MIDLPCPKCAAPACEIEITITRSAGHRMGRACCSRCGASSRMIREPEALGEVTIRDRVREAWQAFYAETAVPGIADALELAWRLIAHSGANHTAKGNPHPQALAMEQIENQLAILGRPVEKEGSHAA